MDSTILFDRKNDEFYATALRKVALSGGVIGRLRRLSLLGSSLRFQSAQARKREVAASAGRTVPGILITSVTRRCNLACVGCYSRALRPGPSEELSDSRFLELFKEAIDLGVGTIMIAGGEPSLRKTLLSQAASLPGVLVPVFTNGRTEEPQLLDLYSQGRLIPVFSVEGEAQDTAARRGPGVHEAVLRQVATLKRRGALFGFSITLTSRNASTVLSDAYLRSLASLGASVVFIIEYVPVSPGTEDLVLRDDQKADLSRPDRFSSYPFMVVSLPGDEESFGGCLAAGRGFIHLAEDGRVEACPFAPYSDASAAEAGLAEALDSPLMRVIRARHGELTETKGGCALWNKAGWVSSLSSCHHQALAPVETVTAPL